VTDGVISHRQAQAENFRVKEFGTESLRTPGLGDSLSGSLPNGSAPSRSSGSHPVNKAILVKGLYNAQRIPSISF